MIRLIVGTCLYVEQGKISIDDVAEALNNQTRLKKDYFVPPQGLTLFNIKYPYIDTKTYDLIFVGSVFSHITFSNIKILLNKLTSSLNKNGILVASFRGGACYEMMIANDTLNINNYYNQLLSDYHDHGFGYQDYKGFEHWGQNLIKPQELFKLQDINSTLKIFIERGWCNIHDIYVYQN
jgi:hypothetical protein